MAMQKSQLTQYRVWNQAIATLRDVLVELANGLQLDETESQFARAAFHACDCQSYPDDLVAWKSNTELAEKYACSERTISNWRSWGAPLDQGQWRMLDWLANQRSLPRGTEVKFAKQLAKRRGEGTDALQSLLREVREIDQFAWRSEPLQAEAVAPAAFGPEGK